MSPEAGAAAVAAAGAAAVMLLTSQLASTMAAMASGCSFLQSNAQ